MFNDETLRLARLMIPNSITVTISLSEAAQVLLDYCQAKFEGHEIEHINVQSYNTVVMTIDPDENGLVETSACRHRLRGN